MIIINSSECNSCNKIWNVINGIIPTKVKCDKCNTIKEICFECTNKSCDCGGNFKISSEKGILI